MSDNIRLVVSTYQIKSVSLSIGASVHSRSRQESGGSRTDIFWAVLWGRIGVGWRRTRQNGAVGSGAILTGNARRRWPCVTPQAAATENRHRGHRIFALFPLSLRLFLPATSCESLRHTDIFRHERLSHTNSDIELAVTVVEVAGRQYIGPWSLYRAPWSSS